MFLNTNGKPIEPNSLLPQWYRCLRACGIRGRGLYSTKDTFVTTAIRVSTTQQATSRLSLGARLTAS